MTIAGLDSSTSKPTSQQLQEAYNAGVRLWCLYMVTRPGVGLYSVAQQADFDRIKAAGLGALAFVSGNDDPAALKAQAAAWGVVICLDDENGIRTGTGWQQGFINASGAGHYGNVGRLTTTAPFKIAALYPPWTPSEAAWPPGYTAPSVPHGWQWQNTHTEFGCSVDRGWYDDAFANFSRQVAQPITPPVSVGGGKMIYTFSVATDPQGNGFDGQFEARNIPWDKRFSATHHGSDPAAGADNAYWPGEVHWQERDGKVLISLTRCRANSSELVDVVTSE